LPRLDRYVFREVAVAWLGVTGVLDGQEAGGDRLEVLGRLDPEGFS
jgi:hypothetical protein